MRWTALAFAALLALDACAVPFDDPRFRSRQDTLVSAALVAPAEARARPRLWYVGLGMEGETWSEGDVADLAGRLEMAASGFRVVPIVFSNRFADMPERYPAVEGRSVEQAMTSIADRAGPDDVVLVYVSTHGAPRLLGRSAGGRQLAPVGLDEMRQWLAPLRDRTTVLVLSACFSGSFIPVLKDEHRIVFTAARADRTSFGCRAGAEHTVFGEALLQALRPNKSLHAVVEDTRSIVAARERELQVTQASQPQISVGAYVQALYDAPVF